MEISNNILNFFLKLRLSIKLKNKEKGITKNNIRRICPPYLKEGNLKIKQDDLFEEIYIKENK